MLYLPKSDFHKLVPRRGDAVTVLTCVRYSMEFHTKNTERIELK